FDQDFWLSPLAIMAQHDPRDSREIPGLPFQGEAFMLPPIRRARIPEREKRTYRACLHCRQRKSRCDLYGSGEPGKPPFAVLAAIYARAEEHTGISSRGTDLSP
ncbi:hypothetical protein KCU63_g23999, partial [Aureobasidium melanogenum]